MQTPPGLSACLQPLPWEAQTPRVLRATASGEVLPAVPPRLQPWTHRCARLPARTLEARQRPLQGGIVHRETPSFRWSPVAQSVVLKVFLIVSTCLGRPSSFSSRGRAERWSPPSLVRFRFPAPRLPSCGTLLAPAGLGRHEARKRGAVATSETVAFPRVSACSTERALTQSG